ncbi:unnamed protein product [Rotaria magnacalcarata]
MTRGNQRDLAREKNQKNQKNKGQSAADTDANKGLSLQERQLRDAARLDLAEFDGKRLENWNWESNPKTLFHL